MTKGIRYLLSLFLAICTAIVIMKFLGITWNDINYFITHGLREALGILKLFQGVTKM